MVKKKEALEKVPKCRICAHEDREGIELVAILSCSSWNVCRERINNTFGTNFTVETIKRHMMEHDLTPSVAEQGVIIDSLRGKDGSSGRISVETMLQTLMVQGMLDLAKGKIRCKTPQELISVVNTLQNVQMRKEQRMALEDGDIQGFYAVMAAYGEAIKDTVSPGQLVEIVAKANALGAHFDIGKTSIEEPLDESPEDIMSAAVRDYRERGGSRSRSDLIEAGVLDSLEAELELPEP